MSYDPNTLDPEEIRKLPMRRDLPLNGLSPEQVIAIGADPQEVEAGRLSQNIWAEQKQRDESLQLVAAAHEAVMQGEAPYQDALQALSAAGEHAAHDALLGLWREEEGWYKDQEAAELIPFLDVDEYSTLVEAQRQQELAKDEAEVESLKRQLAQRQVTDLQTDLKATLGGHPLEQQVEQRLVDKLKASGVLPSTEQERATVIEEALRETAVIGDATESIKQSVDAEWRALRRQNGARDGLMTAADIARAEAAYKTARFEQLADSKMIDTRAMQAQPSSAEQSAALADRYRSRNAKSTDFHTKVTEIATRGADVDAVRDRGAGISEEKARYREAMARAEADASGNSEVKSGYGPNAVDAKPGGFGPGGTWPDELGPAL